MILPQIILLILLGIATTTLVAAPMIDTMKRCKNSEKRLAAGEGPVEVRYLHLTITDLKEVHRRRHPREKKG